MKKVLAIGGTGAMGTYLVPKLVERGYKVDVIANDAVLPEDSANLTYRKADMYDTDTVREVLKNNYDGVVDFMIYDEKAISHYLPIYLVVPRVCGQGAPDRRKLAACRGRKRRSRLSLRERLRHLQG